MLATSQHLEESIDGDKSISRTYIRHKMSTILNILKRATTDFMFKEIQPSLSSIGSQQQCTSCYYIKDPKDLQKTLGSTHDTGEEPSRLRRATLASSPDCDI